MSTSVRPALTKPKQSQVILEGTASLISVTLLLWLLLWFVHQHPNALKVRAYHLPVAGGLVPYLEADVRGLTRAGKGGAVEAADVPGLATRLVDVVGNSKSGVIVSISAPTTALPTELDALDLVRKVAREAKGDVLILLDLAQVDSDRELGLFGNAPYRGLREQLAKEERPRGKGNVVVLCSCAPGQKSWMVDGVGRSAFSYFLQKGLAGAARPVDARGRTSAVTVESLHRFVLANTSRWVAERRRGAIQTPMLLAVGPESRSFALPPVDVASPDAPAPEVAVAGASKEGGAGAAAKEAPAKEGPAVAGEGGPGREGLLDALLKEWREQARIASAPRAPYRDAPAPWRAYEASLLMAERHVRAAWNDGGHRPAARSAIEAAAARRGSVVEVLREAEAAERDFPFRPVAGDPEGKGALNASLKDVTGLGVAELDVPAPSVPSPAGGPAGKLGAEAPRKEERPRLLVEATRGLPAPFVEIQLPAWAARFHEAFGVESFTDNVRGSLLREAVIRRLPAEAALGGDRRGLDWIRDAIRAGDQDRRSVQDELFAVAIADEKDLRDRIAGFGRAYEDARRRGDRHRDARALFERIAARLPYYGEWAVAEDVRAVGEAGPSRAGSPQAQFATVLRSTAALADSIEQPSEPAEMARTLEAASADFRKLEDDYKGRVAGLATRPDAVGWRDLDDVLATPLVPLPERKALLEKVLALEAGFPDSTAPGAPEPSTGAPGGEPADPGFLREALGLARLEVSLRKLAAGGRATAGPAGEVARLEGLVEGVAGAAERPEDPKAVASALGGLAEVVAQVRETSAGFEIRRRKAARESARPEPVLAAELRAVDREVRFRADELRRSAVADPAAKDLEDFARRMAIRFQAERLARDYSRDVASLAAKAEEAYRVDDAPPIAIPSGSLAPGVTPASVEIDRDSHLARLAVGLKVEGDGAGEKVPRGLAFVGVLAPGAAPGPKAADAPAPAATPPPPTEESRVRVTAGSAPSRSGPAGLAGGLLEVGGEAPAPLPFVVEQQGSVEADGAVKVLRAKAFYRGRVDEEGQKKVTVAVACRDFGFPVDVEISQDREALGLRIPQELVKDMVDQFSLDQSNGSLHCRGQLEYVLTFRNRTGEALDLVIDRALRPVGDGEPRAYKPRTARVEPRQTCEVRDKLAATDVPLGKPQQLLVAVADAKSRKPLAAPAKYTFTQFPLDSYIQIRPSQEVLPVDGVPTNCLAIRLIRKVNEPVTEPILFRDLRFSVGNEPLTNLLREGGYLGRTTADNRVIAKYPLLPGDRGKELSWTVEIEGETRQGKERIR